MGTRTRKRKAEAAPAGPEPKPKAPAGRARGRGRGKGKGRGRGRGRGRDNGRARPEDDRDAVHEEAADPKEAVDRDKGALFERKGDGELDEKLREWLQPRKKQLLDLGMKQMENFNQWIEETIGMLSKEEREMPWEAFCDNHLPPGTVVGPTVFAEMEQRTAGGLKTTVDKTTPKRDLKQKGVAIVEATEEKAATGQDGKQPRPMRQGETIMLLSSKGSVLGKVTAQDIETPHGGCITRIELRQQQGIEKEGG